MYFEHTTHSGYDCRDGGLKANNPIQDAVDESKSIWGSSVNYDLLISVGSGRGDRPQKHPSSWKLVPEYLVGLTRALLSTMDGEGAWYMFHRGIEGRIRDRAVRLNVKFDGEAEPALDDKKSVDLMQWHAANYQFYNNSRALSLSLQGDVPKDMLECLAARLQASLFFFEMEYMEEKTEEVAIRGWICCRLSHNEAGFRNLMDRTKGFYVAGQQLQESKRWTASSAPFRHGVFIHESKQNLDKHIRIDVDFGKKYRVSISGFPMTLKALLDYGNEHADNLQTVEVATQPHESHESP